MNDRLFTDKVKQRKIAAYIYMEVSEKNKDAELLLKPEVLRTWRQQVYEESSERWRQTSEVLTENLNVIYITVYYGFTLPTPGFI